ncbi:DMT family transporter [Tissierella sp. Yu-01]|uniref:DMT family transporter n=1 Tax=Tissierella sp. Yu-01 TaxID=3035694 RepID=UPI00240CFDF5|nr:DMT family transporter [Tissierella sp. Yu-01]WFA10172.1 DMT family transporter [Tissierella sp. Yu-01]
MLENIGELAALGTALCWSIVGVAFESAGKKVGSLSVNYIRLILGFVFISIASFFSRGLLFPVDATINNWIWLSISGFIGFFLGDMFLFQSYVEIGSRISSLIMALSPPITALLGYVILRERLKPIGILGMIITTIGIAMVILSRDSEDKKIKINLSPKGLLYAFLGATGQAVGLIFSKVGMGDYNAFAATQIRIIAGFISFTVFIFILKKFRDVRKAFDNKEAMKSIGIGALFGPFIGVTLSLISVRYTTAGISSIISSISPVTIIPFSILILKEKIKPKEIIGAVISVIGVAVMFI